MYRHHREGNLTRRFCGSRQSPDELQVIAFLYVMGLLPFRLNIIHSTFSSYNCFHYLSDPVTPNDAGAKNVGQGNGAQFITGGCINNADCSCQCCAGNPDVGVCSAEAAALQAGKTGCWFEDPNADATSKLHPSAPRLLHCCPQSRHSLTLSSCCRSSSSRGTGVLDGKCLGDIVSRG